VSKIWERNIDDFLYLTNKHNVRMLMVGGGAVNFHGYQRHSADVDFWIDMSDDNLSKLNEVFNEMGFDLQEFPMEVLQQEQNISIKFSPVDLDLDLITKFDVNKSFEEAYLGSKEVIIGDSKVFKYNVLSLEDLIVSKIKLGRPKDLLDIFELRRIHE